jgi:hypothetical protein
MAQLDHMYPANIPNRRVLGMGGIELLAAIPGLGSEQAGLPGIAEWAVRQILGFPGEGKA